MKRILIACLVWLNAVAPASAQAVIVPSPIPALTNNCTLKWQTATSDWVCSSAAAASQPLTDSLGLIADNLDATKILALQLSGLTTATTRTWTIPDANITFPTTIASLATNTFTGLQTMNGGFASTTGTLSSTLAVTGAATFSSTVGVTGAISSATSVALTGAFNNLGTITTGVWNAQAVTSITNSTTRPFSAFGSDSSTSALVASFYSFASGRASAIQFSDSFTYNLAIGSDSAGGFNIWAGRSPGVAGTQVLNVTAAGVTTLIDDLVFSASKIIRTNTSDGSDNLTMALMGGGAAGVTRGGFVRAHGNEHATFPGVVFLAAGDVVGGVIQFYTGAAVIAGVINRSGGMTWGSPTGGDKGAGTINATALYDDNVLLTDWVFDLHYDGEQAKAAPEKEVRIQRGPKRLYSIAEVRSVTEGERRLPWMPTKADFDTTRATGWMITSLWQGQEQQQLFLFDHDAQIKALTSRIEQLERK
jgi:hypothetical protein